MASIDVGIHPDPAGITTKHFAGSGTPFSTLDITVKQTIVSIFIGPERATLDALQAALDEIRADMDQAAQTADADADARDENAKTAARDWPSVLSDMAPGEVMEIHGS